MVCLTEETTRRRRRKPVHSADAARPAGSGKPVARRTRRRKTVSSGKKRVTSQRAAAASVKQPVRRRRTVRKKKRTNLLENPIFQTNGLLGDHGKKWDAPLVVITLMLLFCGWVSLMSASYPDAYYDASKSVMFYAVRQLIYAIVGIVAMLAIAAFDYHRYHALGKGLYVLSIVTLIGVLTPLGTTINNARRWLFGFQPSELAKLAIILTFASFVSLHPERIRTLRGLIPYALAYGAVAGLLCMEPHLSATIIILVVAVAILFVGGMRIWYFLPVGIIGAIGSVVAYTTMTHVHTRVSAWLHPFDFAQSKGFQAVQSLIAIGSGGLFGRGLGQSRQKFLFLPEPMNDFIFSVVCEELGYVGALLFLIMFLYFISRGFLIAYRAPDRFGSLIAVGITTQLGFQILMNLCVVSGIFPVTGVSLPFFSYGGTALVMQLIEVGILLNISRHIPPSRRAEQQLRAAGKRRNLR